MDTKALEPEQKNEDSGESLRLGGRGGGEILGENISRPGFGGLEGDNDREQEQRERAGEAEGAKAEQRRAEGIGVSVKDRMEDSVDERLQGGGTRRKIEFDPIDSRTPRKAVDPKNENIDPAVKMSARSSGAFTSPTSARSQRSLRTTASGTSRQSTEFWPPPSETNVACIFLFVNPASGGNAAASFTAAGLAHAVLMQPDVEVFIADIGHGATGDKPAFKQMRAIVDELKEVDGEVDGEADGAGESSEARILEGDAGATVNCKTAPVIVGGTRSGEMTVRGVRSRRKHGHVFAIMAGGDGTVLWGISEIWEHGIDDRYIVIGVIPYGTGNDLARSLNWNAFNALSPFKNDMKLLKNLMNEWLEAPIVLHDIWSIEIEVEPEGSFKKIDSKTRKKKTVTISGGGIGLASKRLVMKISNYFSVGIESRIGIGFDRHRKNSAFRNKLVYMTEGLKKNLFHRRVKLTRWLDRLAVVQPDPFGGAEGMPKVIFETKNPMAPHKLRKSASLIATNIPSFASGLDVWERARRFGIVADTKNPNEERHQQQVLKAKQVMGDGALEWVVFTGITSLGLENVTGGLGKRVHAGPGVFTLDFNPKLKADERVYFQVDGEFYQMTQPKRITIRPFKQIKCLAQPGAHDTAYRRLIE